jgi:hypothetical protein
VPWFNVDDGFHSHPKAYAAGLEAIGLWTIAGSWSAKHLTNGFISHQTLAKLHPNRNRTWLVRRLVSAGLWEEVGDEGWQFHEWNDDGRNPTPEQVKAAKAANRERQQRYRDRHHNGVTNGVTNASVTRESQRPLPSTPYIGAEVVTDPARGRHQRPVENPYSNGQSKPADSPAARIPSARPLAEAVAAAGIEPGHKPARDEVAARLAAEIRQAITQEPA